MQFGMPAVVVCSSVLLSLIAVALQRMRVRSSK
jgi:hypothetical protein